MFKTIVLAVTLAAVLVPITRAKAEPLGEVVKVDRVYWDEASQSMLEEAQGNDVRWVLELPWEDMDTHQEVQDAYLGKDVRITYEGSTDLDNVEIEDVEVLGCSL